MYEERRSRVGGAIVWTWTATETSRRSRVLPDGCMDLMWRDGRLLAAGPDTHAFEISEAPGVTYAGIRFAPGTGPSVLGVPAGELRDRRVPLDEIWTGPRVREAEERIGEAADVTTALEELTVRHPPEADPLTAAAVAALATGESVAEVSRQVGLSERQLHRRIVAAVGYGPKTLARVLRMNRALRLARAGHAPAEVAAEAGYADQAHLAHDVKALTGRTLTAIR